MYEGFVLRSTKSEYVYIGRLGFAGVPLFLAYSFSLLVSLSREISETCTITNTKHRQEMNH